MSKAHSSTPLSELCDFISGNGFRPTDWKTSGLPIIRIQNLNGATSFNYFDGEVKNDWVVQPGDLLFAWAGVKGVSFGPTIWTGPVGVLNQHIYRIVPRIGVDRYWLYAALKFVTSRIELQAHGFKSSLVHVHKNDIAGQMVDLPTAEEQRKIAAILKTWDEAIEKAQSLRDAKLRRFNGVSQRLLGRTRATGEDLVSHDLPIVTFGRVFSERQERNTNLESHHVVTVGKYAIRKQSEHFKRSVASKDLSGYWMISPGDFVYDPMSAYYGAIGRYSGDSDGLVSPAYRVLRLSDTISPDFMEYLLRSHHIRFLLEARSSQGNKEGKRRLLQRDEFEGIEFFLPSLIDQQKIAEMLSSFESDIAQSERLLTKLKSQKLGLMQKLLTGEWSVKV